LSINELSLTSQFFGESGMQGTNRQVFVGRIRRTEETIVTDGDEGTRTVGWLVRKGYKEGDILCDAYRVRWECRQRSIQTGFMLVSIRI